MAQTTPPKIDELELSLFGPGIGECLVLHLGGGDWIVVDSCWDSSRTNAIALTYLDSIGVNVATQVKSVIVTHWHDDHICGVAQVFRAATAAKFICSAALLNKEFLALVSAKAEMLNVAHTSGMTEFSDVLEEIRSRRQLQKGVAGPDHWALANSVVYSRSNSLPIEVHALSPSPQTLTDAKMSWASLLPAGVVQYIPNIGPNDASIALLVKSPSHSLLLGGDLERGQDDSRGWRAVIQTWQHGNQIANAFKASHHGSQNAHHDSIWSNLLTPKPTALIAPYARGCKPLPSPEDVERIKSLSAATYCTTWPPNQKTPRRIGADRIINRIVKTRVAVQSTTGHIRLRMQLGSNAPATTELFDGAKQL